METTMASMRNVMGYLLDRVNELQDTVSNMDQMLKAVLVKLN